MTAMPFPSIDFATSQFTNFFLSCCSLLSISISKILEKLGFNIRENKREKIRPDQVGTSIQNFEYIEKMSGDQVAIPVQNFEDIPKS